MVMMMLMTAAAVSVAMSAIFSVAVLHALPAGCRSPELSPQIRFDAFPHRTPGPGGGLNPVLGKELQCSSAHSPTEHDIRPLLADKTRDLTRLMGCIIGILNHLAVLDLVSLQINQGKIRTAAKVMGDCTVQTLIIFC